VDLSIVMLVYQRVTYWKLIWSLGYRVLDVLGRPQHSTELRHILRIPRKQHQNCRVCHVFGATPVLSIQTSQSTWCYMWLWVKIRYLHNWMVNTKLDIHICGPLGLPFWPTSMYPSKQTMGQCFGTPEAQQQAPHSNEVSHATIDHATRNMVCVKTGNS
jgi:hypothetical protein